MKYLAVVLVLVLATSAFGLEKKAYQMREDFGTEPTGDWALQYYYYIPCPTYSWFWAFTGWDPGDIIGMCFEVGDMGTGGWEPVDPYNCHTVQMIRVLDFAGYGTVYPGLFTVEFDLWCGSEYCCDGYPGLHLWNSGPWETGYAWNYIPVFNETGVEGVCITPCCREPGPPPGYPIVVVTATHTGTDGIYPAWGMDNISTAIETGCELHDIGCMPAVYPRFPCNTELPKVHGGYIGAYFWQYWPPLCFCDGRDTTLDCTQFGCLELAWRLYLDCLGPTGTESSSWGEIKSMYK